MWGLGSQAEPSQAKESIRIEYGHPVGWIGLMWGLGSQAEPSQAKENIRIEYGHPVGWIGLMWGLGSQAEPSQARYGTSRQGKHFDSGSTGSAEAGG